MDLWKAYDYIPPDLIFAKPEGKKCFQHKWKIEETDIFSKDKVVLLGVTMNNKVKFIKNIHHTSHM